MLVYVLVAGSLYKKDYVFFYHEIALGYAKQFEFNTILMILYI